MCPRVYARHLRNHNVQHHSLERLHIVLTRMTDSGELFRLFRAPQVVRNTETLDTFTVCRHILKLVVGMERDLGNSGMLRKAPVMAHHDPKLPLIFFFMLHL